MLAASTLLHLYFDGFLWKVREKSTSENLGIEGGRVEPTADARPRTEPGAGRDQPMASREHSSYGGAECAG